MAKDSRKMIQYWEEMVSMWDMVRLSVDFETVLRPFCDRFATDSGLF